MTISLPAEILGEAERLAASRGARTRSAVVERALRLMVRQLRKEEIARSLDEYYSGQSSAERDEEATLLVAFRRLRRGADLDREPTAAEGRRRR